MNNPGVKWGIYLGIASIAVTLIMYLVNPMWMFQSKAMLFGLAVTIAFLVMAGSEKREDLGGYASFGQIFPTLFIACIISAVVSLIFNYVMMNFIDPGLIDVQKEAAMESSRWMMEKMGVDGDAMDEAMAATEEALEEQDIAGVGQVFKGLIASAVIGAIISAIMSLFLKKKNPEKRYTFKRHISFFFYI